MVIKMIKKGENIFYVYNNKSVFERWDNFFIDRMIIKKEFVSVNGCLYN